VWGATSTPAPGLPVVTSVGPASGGSAGGYLITVTGTNLLWGAQIYFGGTALTTTWVSATQLTAYAPASGTGPVTVTVANPGPVYSTTTRSARPAAPAPGTTW
jgi:hypothetical protein